MRAGKIARAHLLLNVRFFNEKSYSSVTNQLIGKPSLIYMFCKLSKPAVR